jgi:molybdopterin biosynthesis enzyme MoaB
MTNAAVLTISDSVSAGTRADRSGPAVRERLEQLGWSVSVMEAIPDETSEIAARLSTLADGARPHRWPCFPGRWPAPAGRS